MAKAQAPLPGAEGRQDAATEWICKPPAIDLWRRRSAAGWSPTAISAQVQGAGRFQEWRGPPSRPKVQLGRLAGVGDGKVFRPPVMMAGPQFPDQLGRRHSQHGAARVSQAVAGDSAVDRVAQPTPSPVPHHQQIIALIEAYAFRYRAFSERSM